MSSFTLIGIYFPALRYSCGTHAYSGFPAVIVKLYVELAIFIGTGIGIPVECSTIIFWFVGNYSFIIRMIEGFSLIEPREVILPVSIGRNDAVVGNRLVNQCNVIPVHALRNQGVNISRFIIGKEPKILDSLQMQVVKNSRITPILDTLLKG